MRTNLAFLLLGASLAAVLIGIVSTFPWEPMPASCRLWSETPRFGSYVDEINGELYICSDI